MFDHRTRRIELKYCKNVENGVTTFGISLFFTEFSKLKSAADSFTTASRT